MGPLLGAALSFGSSFLSGLFGQSGAKKRANEEKRAIDEANRINQGRADAMNATIRARADRAAKIPITTMQTGNTNMSMMVSDSVRNGFNPLTVLRAGGLGLYANTKTTVTGSTMMDAALAGQHISTFQPLISQTQVPTTGEVLGSAINSGVGTYQQMMSTQQAQQFQTDLVQMQLAGANANSANNHLFQRSFYTPSAQTSGGSIKVGGGELRSGSTKAPSWWDAMDPSSWLDNVKLGKGFANPGDKKDPQIALAKHNYMGLEIWHDRTTSDGSVVADRYGESELAETATFAATALADAMHNVRDNAAFAGIKYSPALMTMAPSFGAGRLIVDYLRTGMWGAAGYVPGKGNLSSTSKGMKAFQ